MRECHASILLRWNSMDHLASLTSLSHFLPIIRRKGNPFFFFLFSSSSFTIWIHCTLGRHTYVYPTDTWNPKRDSELSASTIRMYISSHHIHMRAMYFFFFLYDMFLPGSETHELFCCLAWPTFFFFLFFFSCLYNATDFDLYDTNDSRTIHRG